MIFTTRKMDAPPGRLDGVASSWQAGQVKPAPAFFAAVAKRCGRPPDDAILIGHSPEVTGAAERQEPDVLLATALSAGVSRLLQAGPANPGRLTR
jgi:hypothetical protein